MELTLAQLLRMTDGEMFATGVTNEPILHNTTVRWVAVRGSGPHGDWAIYYNDSKHTPPYIMENGEKVSTERIIKDLVPCDNQAFSIYRY